MSAPKLPAGLPKLPKGYVYLGMGHSFKTNGPFSGFSFSEDQEQWNFDNGWVGHCLGFHYAAPIDSEIARLNGHKKAAKKRVKSTLRTLAYNARENSPASECRDFIAGWLKGYRAAMRRAKHG